MALDTDAGAQANSKTDSLRVALGRATADSTRVRLLCQLAQTFAFINGDSALQLSTRAWQLARQSGQRRGEALALEAVANAYNDKDEFEQAAEKCRQAMGIWRRLGDTGKEYELIRKLGMLEYRQSNYPKAIRYSLKALRYFEQTPNTDQQTRALRDLALVYTDMKDDATGEKYFRRWLSAVARQPLKTAEDSVQRYSLIGNLYNRLDKFDQALVYVKKARQHYHGPRLSARSAYLLINLGDAYFDLEQYAAAQQPLQEALAISRQLQLHTIVIQSRMVLAQVLLKLRQHRRATEHIRQAVAEAEQLNDKNTLAQVYRIALDIAERTGHYQEATAYTSKYLAVQDSIFSRKNRKQAQAAQARYDNYRREQEAAAQRYRIAQLRNEQRITQLWAGVLGLALLAGAAGVVAAVRQRRLRAERDNAQLRAVQAELEARQLRAQEDLRQTQHALELKNGELAGLALKVNHKEQLMADVKEELRAAAQTSEGPARAQLRKLQQSLAINTQAGPNWDYFQQVLEQVHPRFFTALQRHHPDVTLHERRLAALLRLNLTTKDIAAVMHISEDGVKKARYRLRRKFRLNAEDSLTAFILAFDDETTPPAPAV